MSLLITHFEVCFLILVSLSWNKTSCVLSILKSLSSSVKGNFWQMFFLGFTLPMPPLKLLNRLTPEFRKVKLANKFLKTGGILSTLDIGVPTDGLEKRGWFVLKPLDWVLGNLSVLRLTQTCFVGLPVLRRPDFQFSKWGWSGFVLFRPCHIRQLQDFCRVVSTALPPFSSRCAQHYPHFRQGVPLARYYLGECFLIFQLALQRKTSSFSLADTQWHWTR